MPGWIEHVWKCDACGEEVRQRDLRTTFAASEPPEPWRFVSILGYAGKFVSCSEDCQRVLEARVERPEPAPAEPTFTPIHITMATALIALDRARLALTSDLEIGPKSHLESAIRELEAAINSARELG